MEIQTKLIMDINKLEEDLQIHEDELAVNDKSEEYLINRLAKLRVIKNGREIVERGSALFSTDASKLKKLSKMQAEQLKEKVSEEFEKVKEYEMGYLIFNNVYMGKDEIYNELLKIVNEYKTLGIVIDESVIERVDNYMTDKYALTEERIIKNDKKDDNGGLGMGMQSEVENDM